MTKVAKGRLITTAFCQLFGFVNMRYNVVLLQTSKVTNDAPDEI